MGRSVWCRNFALFFSLVGMLTSCKIRQTDSNIKIADGTDIGKTEFPATSLLWVERMNKTYSCTATFINDYQAITAAHCVKGVDPNVPLIFLMTIDGTLQDGTPNYTEALGATDFHYHPLFNGAGSQYDLAIVNFPSNTAPAMAPFVTTPMVFRGSIRPTCTVVGFGSASFNQNLKPEIKRRGDFEVRGRNSHQMLESVGRPHFESLTGSGDSGAPLYCNGQVSGILSGINIENDGRQDSRVISYYVDIGTAVSQTFINAHLGKNRSKAKTGAVKPKRPLKSPDPLE